MTASESHEWPDSLNRGWTLHSLVERTPDEMLEIYLKRHAWTEAHALAGKHGLDTNLIFKFRWSATPVDENNINENLKPVTDRRWVIEQCLARVADVSKVQKELLEYGTLETERWYHRARSVPVDGSSALPEGGIADRDWLLLRRMDLLGSLDRLETFCRVQEGEYSAQAYDLFRVCDLAFAARAFAALGDLTGLQILLQRHTRALFPKMLDILSHIPEATDPRLYTHLLPLPGTMAVDMFIPARDADWAETQATAQLLMASIKETTASSTVMDTEHILAFSDLDTLALDEKSLEKWYTKRAKDIDSATGQLGFAKALLEMGVEKGLGQDVAELLKSVQFLSGTVKGSQAGWFVGLEEFSAMSRAGQLKLLLEGSTIDRVEGDLEERILPFFAGLDSELRAELLSDLFATQMGARLEWCERLAELEAAEVRLFGSGLPGALAFANSVTTGILVWPQSAQWDQLNVLLRHAHSCLEAHEHELEGCTSPGCNKAWSQAVSEIEVLNGCISVGKRLSGLGVVMAIDKIKSMDQEGGLRAVRTILARASRAGRSWPDAKWEGLARDLQAIGRRLPMPLESETVTAELCRALLRAGKFAQAQRQLAGDVDSALEKNNAEMLVLSAGREFLYSASSLDVPAVSDARECFQLLPDSQAARLELKVIEALQMLPARFGLNVLPMQMKQSSRSQVLQHAVTTRAENYKDREGLKILAGLLDVTDPNELSELDIMVGWAALHAGDLAAAQEIAVSLMKTGFENAWEFCGAVGQFAHRTDVEQGVNVETCMKLLAFATVYCPDDRKMGFVKTLVTLTSLLKSFFLWQFLGMAVMQGRTRNEVVLRLGACAGMRCALQDLGSGGESKDDVLELARNLAAKYGTDAWDLSVAFLESALLAATEITPGIGAMAVCELEKLLDRPQDTLCALVFRVWSGLPGAAEGKLTYVLSLMAECLNVLDQQGTHGAADAQLQKSLESESFWASCFGQMSSEDILASLMFMALWEPVPLLKGVSGLYVGAPGLPLAICLPALKFGLAKIKDGSLMLSEESLRKVDTLTFELSKCTALYSAPELEGVSRAELSALLDSDDLLHDMDEILQRLLAQRHKMDDLLRWTFSIIRGTNRCVDAVQNDCLSDWVTKKVAGIVEQMMDDCKSRLPTYLRHRGQHGDDSAEDPSDAVSAVVDSLDILLEGSDVGENEQIEMDVDSAVCSIREDVWQRLTALIAGLDEDLLSGGDTPKLLEIQASIAVLNVLDSVQASDVGELAAIAAAKDQQMPSSTWQGHKISALSHPEAAALLDLLEARASLPDFLSACLLSPFDDLKGRAFDRLNNIGSQAFACSDALLALLLDGRWILDFVEQPIFNGLCQPLKNAAPHPSLLAAWPRLCDLDAQGSDERKAASQLDKEPAVVGSPQEGWAPLEEDAGDGWGVDAEWEETVRASTSPLAGVVQGRDWEETVRDAAKAGKPEACGAQKAAVQSSKMEMEDLVDGEGWDASGNWEETVRDAEKAVDDSSVSCPPTPGCSDRIPKGEIDVYAMEPQVALEDLDAEACDGWGDGDWEETVKAAEQEGAESMTVLPGPVAARLEVGSQQDEQDPGGGIEDEQGGWGHSDDWEETVRAAEEAAARSSAGEVVADGPEGLPAGEEAWRERRTLVVVEERGDGECRAGTVPLANSRLGLGVEDDPGHLAQPVATNSDRQSIPGPASPIPQQESRLWRFVVDLGNTAADARWDSVLRWQA
ncbi:unnamed protein product [Ostreobium quekettii]|uniref:Sec39 domain-containing protein n=1 Tax=Ostreobium quekettii TaxID=121088 RepID=A0A8S1JCU0_9CHLO|nr:unnamed protein product [Ostreobium quekettii]